MEEKPVFRGKRKQQQAPCDEESQPRKKRIVKQPAVRASAVCEEIVKQSKEKQRKSSKKSASLEEELKR
jgi:hypothetical protein